MTHLNSRLAALAPVLLLPALSLTPPVSARPAGSAAAAVAASPAPAAPCPPPAIAPRPVPGLDLATERRLGEVLSRTRDDGQLKRIRDDALQARLDAIAARLTAPLGAAAADLRFFLSDLPATNAITVPGGRIYVTRKLVAACRSEDELASVLGHEIGHAMRRDPGATMAALLRAAGDPPLTTEAEMEAALHAIAELHPERRPRARGDHDEKQESADRFGLELTAAAGYRAQDFLTFWDHLYDVKGKAGNWLTDVFGLTAPGGRRFRGQRATLENLPRGCAPATAPAPADEVGFRAWQAAVVEWSPPAGEGTLTGVRTRAVLAPPLRCDVDHLRFSPDGKLLLAQDEGSIHVLDRATLRPLLTIDAPDALPAGFTPDARAVAFHTAALRVESWDVAGRQRTLARELPVTVKCAETALAPDGGTVACRDVALGLSLFDVASGERIHSNPGFLEPRSELEQASLRAALVAALLGRGGPLIELRFAPDSSCLVAAAGEHIDAYDLRARKPLKLPGALASRISRGSFTFLAADRVLAVNGKDPARSAILAFPGGEPLAELALGRQKLEPAAAASYALLRPVAGYAAGLLDVRSGRIVGASRTPALDTDGTDVALMTPDGGVALVRLGESAPRAFADLPTSRLDGVRTAAVSDDLRWIAVSGKGRGGVFEVATGQRTLLSVGFKAAAFRDDGSLAAWFPVYEEHDRAGCRVDPVTGCVAPGFESPEGATLQLGPYLGTLHPRRRGEPGKDVDLVARDMVSGEEAWTRRFEGNAPALAWGAGAPLAVASWALESEAARAIVGRDVPLYRRVQTMKERADAVLLETIDVASGETRHRLVIPRPGLFPRVVAAGAHVAVTDGASRVLVYDAASGTRVAQLFGSLPQLSPAGDRLALRDAEGTLHVLRLPGLEKLRDLRFPDKVAFVQFSRDGERLVALTAAQEVYVIDLALPLPG